MISRNHLFRSNNTVEHFESGLPYFSKLEELINQARYSIHLQVYIFKTDTTGNKILDALKNAAKRGVQVYLVVDAYASSDFTTALIDELKSLGIWVKKFAPIHLKQFKVGRRLHHKIVLVDNAIALVGGINIADHYSGFHGQTPWLDVAVSVEGPVVHDLKKICLAIWPKRIRKKWKKEETQRLAIKGTTKLRVLQNDWWRRRIELSSAYNAAFRLAEKDIIIVASYFLPGFTKRRLIKKAADRGVSITLITGHDSDIPFMNAAVKYLYGIMLKNNIRIYEWNQSVLHAKMAIVDNRWCTIGSYNINALSDYGSLEANIAIDDTQFAQGARQRLMEIIETGCTEVNAKTFYQSNTLLKQFTRWMSYKIMRLSLVILFILMNRDKLKRP